MKLLAGLSLALVSSSCVVAIGKGGCGSHSLEVDGVELEHEHQQTMTVEAWHESGLEVTSAMGDLFVERSAGPNEITVVVHEKDPGDGYVVYENGRLESRSRSGAPTAIGDVTVRVGAEPRGLKLETGMGDVALDGVGVDGVLSLATGMGDVEAKNVPRAARLVLGTGMGEVTVRDASCGHLGATSGMGGVDLHRVTAEEGSASSGMGDVVVRDSTFVELSATTGLGDVHLTRTSYQSSDVDTGLGSVRRDG